MASMSSQTAKLAVFISTKGSVGKTTQIIQIAGFLASQNKRVLLIDADSQQSLSKFFNYKGIDSSIGQRGFSSLLLNEEPVQSLIIKTAHHQYQSLYENIDIIVNDDPDNYRTSRYLRGSSGAVFSLATILDQVRHKYDYIFIDTEGTDGRNHDGRSVQNAALLAKPDIVVSMTQPNMLYAQETSRVFDVFKAAIKEYQCIGQNHNPPLTFIINAVDASLKSSAIFVDELRAAFAQDENLRQTKLLKTLIPLKRKFFEAYYREKIFAHQYNDKGKDPINFVIPQLCEELFPELVSESEEA